MSCCNEGSTPVCAISDKEARQSARAFFEDLLLFTPPELAPAEKSPLNVLVFFLDLQVVILFLAKKNLSGNYCKSSFLAYLMNC